MTTSEVHQFLASFKSLVMASITSEHLPHASTAPFLQIDSKFYILISTVAQHGRNLLHNPNVSLLFAEDEALCIQPYARKRITIEAAAEEIVRDTDTFIHVIEQFKVKFEPELITSLSSMGDFHLFELTPSSGSAVMGFGKAYRLNEMLEVQTHIIGQHQTGHKHG